MAYPSTMPSFIVFGIIEGLTDFKIVSRLCPNTTVFIADTISTKGRKPFYQTFSVLAVIIHVTQLPFLSFLSGKMSDNTRHFARRFIRPMSVNVSLNILITFCRFILKGACVSDIFSWSFSQIKRQEVTRRKKMLQ